MKINCAIIILAAGALLLCLVGCDEEKYNLKFSHYVHVTDNEMDCDECHGELGSPAFKVMNHDTCIDCHDEPEAEVINKKTCGYCHQEKLLSSLEEWVPESGGPKRSVFVHAEALAGKCRDCHGEIFSESLTAVPKLKRNDVVQIRNASHASGQDCLTCHVDMDRYQEPVSHDQFWMKRHATFGMQDDAACGVCHSEDSCRECHSVMQPVSHNNMWRLKTHGVVSAWDRQRCMVCHEEDSCTSCHSQVKPRSHGPLWDERHGTWDPGRCMVCHEPDTCNSCHSENSPRSHRAMWDDRHCTQCHVTAGESCMVCHEGGNNKAELHQDEWPSSHDSFNNQTDCLRCHPF